MAGLSNWAASAVLLLVMCAARAAARDNCGASSPPINDPICGASPSLTNCNDQASLTRHEGTFLEGNFRGFFRTADFGTHISDSEDLGACCTSCQAKRDCDAWNVLHSQGCYHISAFNCQFQFFQEVSSETYTDAGGTIIVVDSGYYGTGGILAQERCIPPMPWAGIAFGRLDPHFEITGLNNYVEELNSSFTFDFHGEDGKNYCMVSDNLLEVIVQMFSLSPDSVVLQRPEEEVDPFFEGTWMKGFGILYHDQSQEPHRISILLDPAADRLGEQPFNATFVGVPMVALDAPGPVLWKSPDGLAIVVREAGRINSLVVSISDLLEMEVVTDSEKELIAEPPVHFLNFNLRNITTTPTVHGFLGQMFAPGAISERLDMGTLEGLRHREYVEGTDDEYAASSLTEADCSFSRFGKGAENNDAGGLARVSAELPRAVSSGRRLLRL